MNTLSNKVDFAVIVCVRHANPNGDPLSGNRPRITYDDLGEISDVAIKRKIRNRLMDMGNLIFVQPDDRRQDNYLTLQKRAQGEISDEAWKDNTKQKIITEACSKWMDIRTFGQVLAFKGDDLSVGIRGPVSIHPAFSVAPVTNRVASSQITRSVSASGTGEKRASDTMGMKHRVDHGVYVFYGSMNPQLASKTGFSDEDAQAIKEALRTLFVNDASSARPEGSMEVFRVYWWEHDNPNGKYSSAKVHNAVRSKVGVRDGGTEPKDIGDYDYPSKEEIEKELPGLKCEVIDGE